MDAVHKISSKKEKRRKKLAEETLGDPDCDGDNSKKKKSKRKKTDANGDTNDFDVPQVSTKKVKNKVECNDIGKKSAEANLEDDVLISDIKRFIGELFDGYEEETENGIAQSKTSKKEKEKKVDNEDRKYNSHKIFNDDFVSSAPDVEGGEKVKKKKRSKVDNESQLVDMSYDSSMLSSPNNQIAEVRKRKKEKSNTSTPKNETSGKNVESTRSVCDIECRRKMKKKKKSLGQENRQKTSDKICTDKNPVEEDEPCKKKKKKKKADLIENRLAINDKSAVLDNSPVDANSVCEDEPRREKKKKKKSSKRENELDENVNKLPINDKIHIDTICVLEEKPNKGKKKRKKSKGEENELGSNADKSVVKLANIKVGNDGDCKKRKKDTSGKADSDVKNVYSLDKSDDSSVGKKKKRKGKVSSEGEIDNHYNYSEKKKKSKDEMKNDDNDTVDSDVSEVQKEYDQKESKKDKTKNKTIKDESSDCENDLPVKRRRTEPYQESVNFVFESKERCEKFKRLVGGKKKESSQFKTDELLCRKETTTTTNNDVSDGSYSSSTALSAGQWGGMMFENADRQNKFIRLLGGAKSTGLFSSGNTAPKKGLFGSLASKVCANGPGNSDGGRQALGLQAATSLNEKLENDYNRALSRRLDGMGSSGIGFVKDPAEGKKFHINTNAVKSTKFDDDDE